MDVPDHELESLHKTSYNIFQLKQHSRRMLLMENSFQNNPFFDPIPPQTRSLLCDNCRFYKYAKGQRLNYRYWENQVAILEEGLLVYMDVDENGNSKTSGLGARGLLISPGPLIDVWSMPTADREVLCFLDSTVVVFDAAVVKQLSDNILFIRTLYDNILQHCMAEKQLFLQNVGGNDSYSAVRYILQWCKKNQISSLTHEQIAIMCNRSRPTVTQMLHAILTREPELYPVL